MWKVFLVKTKINSTNVTERFVETVEINGNPYVGCTCLINRKKSQQPECQVARKLVR